jgi:hypothetical protein
MQFAQQLLLRLHFLKITNLPMLQQRTTGESPPVVGRKNRRNDMERIYRALGLAAALGTSGLMFALTLA